MNSFRRIDTDMRPFITGLIIIMTCATTMDCRGAENMRPQLFREKMETARLIIEFRDANLDPSRADVVQSLARDAGATLVYVRPLSGRAHVFQVRDINSDAQLAEIIQRLSKRADVKYVEQDRVMHHQEVK